MRLTSLRAARRIAASAALSLAVLTAPARADVRLVDAYAGPVTPSSYCTAEPADAYFGSGNLLPWSPTRLGLPDPLSGAAAPNPTILTGPQPQLQAGAVTDFCLAMRFSPQSSGAATQFLNDREPPYPPTDPATHPLSGDDVATVDVDMPTGFLAALRGVPACSDADFAETFAFGGPAATCPSASRVGEVNARAQTFHPANSALRQSLRVTAYGRSSERADITDPEELTTESVYRLETAPGDVATLGVDTQPAAAIFATKARISVRLASDGSGRLVARARMPRVAYYTNARNVFGLYIEAIGIQLWGAAADHTQAASGSGLTYARALPQDFAENGTDCSTPVTTRIIARTFGGPPVIDPTTRTIQPDPSTYVPVQSTAERSYRLTGCDRLEFHPSVEVTTTARTPGTPTGATVRLRLGQQTSNGLRSALLRDAAVTLPAGLELGAQVGSGADGLRLCDPAAFAADDPARASQCPGATRAATVTITTPLLDEPFSGRAWLGRPVDDNPLPQLYLEASMGGASTDEAPRIKLVGSVRATDDGTLTATFTNAPQLRFSELELTFPAGDHALFVTPQRCGTTTGRSALTPWSTNAATTVDATLTIDQGCEPSGRPSVVVTPLDPQAGASAATRIELARPSDASWFRAINVHLPSGLLADLNAATECAADAARTGDCPETSRIGTVRVLAGAGPAPLPLQGALYLAEREPGAVAGAVIVTRAAVGDLDLGTVVVPGRIELRAEDAGLDFRAEVPLRFKGVALGLQRVTVDLDRTGFGLNPSACGPLPYSAEVTDDAGVTTSAAGAATYTGCERLPFRPQLRATLTGENAPGGHPGMYVELNSPAGDSAMRSAVVTLPQGVAAALPNVQNPCTRSDFDATRCPARTRVGRATARVSITPDAITGDIYLVKVPGKTLPGLGLSFTGRYAQRVLSTVEVNKDGRLVTNFGAIPDLPLRQLIVEVDSGPRSPLQLPPGGSCVRSTAWDGAFIAQGGQIATARTGLQCAAPAAARLTDRRGLSVRLFDFGGRNLRYVKATLPAGWRFDRAAAKRKGALWVRMSGATPSVTLTSRSLVARATKGRATDVRVKIGGGVVRPSTARAPRAKTLTIPLRLVFTDGTVELQQLTAATR